MNQQRAAREGGSKGWISGARIRNESEKKAGGGEAKGSPGLSFAHGGRGAAKLAAASTATGAFVVGEGASYDG